MPQAVKQLSQPIEGFTSIGGEAYYCIPNFDRMPPFLMTVSSDSDLWMFLTSRGGLTAGRVNADGSLFPYETDDKLYDGHHHTGPITLIRVESHVWGGLWEPFTASGEGVERNLYKNALGSSVIFEEIHPELPLRLRCRWSAADALGWVRTVTLENFTGKEVKISLLDGVRNVLPFGASLRQYQEASTLIDAYKQSEFDPSTGLAIYSLTSKIIDRPVAEEELRANVVWSHGLEEATVSLGIEAVDAFRARRQVEPSALLTGRRGNYLLTTRFALEAGESKVWRQIADSGRSQNDIAALSARLLQTPDFDTPIEVELTKASRRLRALVAGGDGLQVTQDVAATEHHASNVLFNGMRGGFFDHNYQVRKADFLDFVRVRNRKVAEQERKALDELPASFSVMDLRSWMGEKGGADIQRLSMEYLPLFFGRRHGDPSRPWNSFSIRVWDEEKNRRLFYEGNWRDVFQNWEALTLGYPHFLPNLIAKFVNASTVDGFNPYRIDRNGIDWETPDPEDPWSHIGYWGDHQIIYLLKFLEALKAYDPQELGRLLDQPIYSYADIPYRLRDYEQIVANPYETIEFDTGHEASIDLRVESLGSDGRLVQSAEGAVRHVRLLEKLFVPLLSKLSNFVPEGGIWMNTQRPEWNDANNALVGDGLSVVTLLYLRRYLAFLESVVAAHTPPSILMSAEVVWWIQRVKAVLETHKAHLSSSGSGLNDRDRKAVMDSLGRLFSDYRSRAYDQGPGEPVEIDRADLLVLCREALAFVDQGIDANRRPDGMYHSYNLVQFNQDHTEAAVKELSVMLEGQVAALSSGRVTPQGAVKLLMGLQQSPLYTDVQQSFLLYPERTLPRFMDKNTIPQDAVLGIPLLEDMLRKGNSSIVSRDSFAVYRFHPDCYSAGRLQDALHRLREDPVWGSRVPQDADRILELYESVFDHKHFTGRSGTMYAYEGIGSVYWHMVVKLLLAIQEVAWTARRDQESAALVDALAQNYYRIRSGLGFNKAAGEYGAFPTDAYSHTPAHAGAQQPGMTGQVKETILTRMGELGVRVAEGRISFDPFLLRKAEFLEQERKFAVVDAFGASQTFVLSPGSLGFTFCQVPILYRLGDGGFKVWVSDNQGKRTEGEARGLDALQSRAVFDRRGHVTSIEVSLGDSDIRS